MKERAIIYLCGVIVAILLIAVLWLFTGSEEIEFTQSPFAKYQPPVSYGYIHIWCEQCEKELIGTYLVEYGYCLTCSTCGTVYSNVTEVEIIDSNFVTEPNNANYKGWFGWE